MASKRFIEYQNKPSGTYPVLQVGVKQFLRPAVPIKSRIFTFAHVGMRRRKRIYLKCREVGLSEPALACYSAQGKKERGQKRLMEDDDEDKKKGCVYTLTLVFLSSSLPD